MQKNKDRNIIDEAEKIVVADKVGAADGESLSGATISLLTGQPSKDTRLKLVMQPRAAWRGITATKEIAKIDIDNLKASYQETLPYKYDGTIIPTSEICIEQSIHSICTKIGRDLIWKFIRALPEIIDEQLKKSGMKYEDWVDGWMVFNAQDFAIHMYATEPQFAQVKAVKQLVAEIEKYDIATAYGNITQAAPIFSLDKRKVTKNGKTYIGAFVHPYFREYLKHGGGGYFLGIPQKRLDMILSGSVEYIFWSYVEMQWNNAKREIAAADKKGKRYPHTERIDKLLERVMPYDSKNSQKRKIKMKLLATLKKFAGDDYFIYAYTIEYNNTIKWEWNAHPRCLDSKWWQNFQLRGK